MDWIVKTFCGYIFEDYNQIGLKSAISQDKFYYNSFSRMSENFCGKDRAKSTRTSKFSPLEINPQLGC